MSFTRTGTKMLSRLLSLTLLLAALLTPAAADDSPHLKCWTSVGSAGTVDEAARDKLVFQGAIVSFPEILPPLPNAQLLAVERTAEFAQSLEQTISLPTQTTQAVIRYNVVATDGLFQNNNCVQLLLRFRDDGNQARVFARLIEVNLGTGAATTRVTFDSNLFNPSPNFQTAASGANLSLDFGQNAYYVEVTLTKISPIVTPFGGGKPALAALQVCASCPLQ